MKYETVIGLEVHLQLSTQSKLFCGCAATFGAPPNSQTCPVCLGLPGVLPVLNQRALEWGIKAALAFECRLAPVMKFDRKQYYYPDLPKGYQISQYDQPLCHDGHLDVPTRERTVTVRIRRIHLEEDAGKLMHDPNSPASYVDFNRAGVPLLEIVTEPDLRTPEDAQQYLLELKAVLEYLDISTCDMEKGSLRCDCNVSLRKPGAAELGSKVEVKNLNSFKAVKAALHYEIVRQTKLLDLGQRIPQETRLWDAKAEVTESMRSKEEASDYRYFPEPDLVPFTIKPEVLDAVARQLPVLPAQRRAQLMEAYGISAYDANALTQQRSLAGLFEGAITLGAKPKPVANWIMGDLLGYANAKGKQPEEVRLEPAWLVHLIEAIESGTISGKMAKELFLESIEQQQDPADIIKAKGLRQIVDEGELERLADEVLAANQKSVDDYRKGKANALMFLVGQCMQRSKGKANPGHMTDILKKKLARILAIGLLAFGLAGALGAATLFAKRASNEEALYKELELFTDALSIVEADYVEAPEAKQLVYGALKGMLATLDPYSQFLDPDSYNELKVDTEGQFGGLGIEITIKDELLTVITPIDDTPAYKAGLKANDRIVKIDGEITRGITLMDAVKKLRGKPGSQVVLTILREGENELKEFELTRDVIRIQSIREARIVEDHIGYVRLTDFREGTPKDLENALEKLKEQAVDSLILDLRNNPGGLLDVSVSVSELFLDRRKLIVSTKGRLKSQNFEFRSRSDGMLHDLPMVVLVNEGSASASEIVAGAMQDHRRAIILGTKSHGKASVQTIFPLKDGSALRLTTSKYFTPAGRSIHGEGIHPDVVVPFEPPPPAKDEKANGVKEVFERLERREEQEEEVPKPSSEKMDNQLARAVDLLKGIKVYQSSLKPAIAEAD